MSTSDFTSGAVERAQEAVSRATDIWKQSAQAFTNPADVWGELPRIDPVEQIQRYYDLIQKIVDVNRELALQWAQAVGSLTNTVRDQAQSLNRVAAEQAELTKEGTRRAADATREAGDKAAPAGKDASSRS